MKQIISKFDCDTNQRTIYKIYVLQVNYEKLVLYIQCNQGRLNSIIGPQGKGVYWGPYLHNYSHE